MMLQELKLTPEQETKMHDIWAGVSDVHRQRRLRTAVARLFKDEKDPIVIIKWKEVYENLENASDRCEDVANIIEGVILEHA